jgi:hypothetical protein
VRLAILDPVAGQLNDACRFRIARIPWPVVGRRGRTEHRRTAASAHVERLPSTATVPSPKSWLKGRSKLTSYDRSWNPPSHQYRSAPASSLNASYVIIGRTTISEAGRGARTTKIT